MIGVVRVSSAGRGISDYDWGIFFILVTLDLCLLLIHRDLWNSQKWQIFISVNRDLDFFLFSEIRDQKRVRYFCCWRKGGIPPSITVPTWSEKNGKNCIRDIQNNLLSISLIVIKSLAKVFLRKKKVGGLTLVHSDRGCRWLLQTPTRNCSSRTQFDTWCYPQSRKY